MKRIKAHSIVALAAIALIGCGGGGGGGKSDTTAARARVGVFVTDDLGNYDHVWVTVKSVVLTGTSGSTSVFDDAEGKLVDLASLHGASGSIFSCLGLSAAPAGTYTSVQVVLDDDLTLFPAGATVGLARTFAGSTAGTKTLSVLVDDHGEEIRGDDALVIDFDLAAWTDDGATVTPVAKIGGHDGLDDPERHHGEAAKGSVVGLSSAGFTLNGRGLPISVTIDASTTVFGGTGTLANGERVEVRGVFSATGRTLAATSIKIEDGDANEVNEAEVRGTVVSSGTDAFDLTAALCDGFLPSSTTVHVVPAASAVYRGAHGAVLTKEAFFAALAAGEAVEAEGAYDAGTNSLAATKLKVEAENEGGHGGGDDHGGSTGGGDDHGGGGNTGGGDDHGGGGGTGGGDDHGGGGHGSGHDG